MKDFVLKFKGLASGKHQYNYTLAEKFFAKLNNEDLPAGNIEVEVLLTKEDTMLTVEIAFEGELQVMCDRCLDIFALPIKGENKFYVKFGKEGNATSEEIVYLSENEHEIDLFDEFAQSIITVMPMTKVHPNDENGNTLCNAEMLKRLEELSAEEVETQEIDPRWEMLKKVKI